MESLSDRVDSSDDVSEDARTAMSHAIDDYSEFAGTPENEMTEDQRIARERYYENLHTVDNEIDVPSTLLGGKKKSLVKEQGKELNGVQCTNSVVNAMVLKPIPVTKEQVENEAKESILKTLNRASSKLEEEKAGWSDSAREAAIEARRAKRMGYSSSIGTSDKAVTTAVLSEMRESGDFTEADVASMKRESFDTFSREGKPDVVRVKYPDETYGYVDENENIHDTFEGAANAKTRLPGAPVGEGRVSDVGRVE